MYMFVMEEMVVMHKGRVISGFLKHRTIIFPNIPTTRPTTDAIKEALFNCLRHRFNLNFEEWSVIDAFAGSGALGIEAISLGTPFVLFFEQNPIAYSTICKNITNLGIGKHSAVLRADVTKYRMNNLLHKFSNKILIIMDPPYKETHILKNLIKKFATMFHKHKLIITAETDNVSAFTDMPCTHVISGSGSKKILISQFTNSSDFELKKLEETEKLEA